MGQREFGILSATAHRLHAEEDRGEATRKRLMAPHTRLLPPTKNEDHDDDDDDLPRSNVLPLEDQIGSSTPFECAVSLCSCCSWLSY